MEVLISSVIVLLVAFTLVTSYMYSRTSIQKVKDTALLDAEGRAFLSFIEADMHGGYQFVRSNNFLQFRDQYNDSILYEVRDKRIIRRVNFTGYVVLLSFVRAVNSEVVANGCWFHLELERNQARWKGSVFLAGRVMPS